MHSGRPSGSKSTRCRKSEEPTVNKVTNFTFNANRLELHLMQGMHVSSVCNILMMKGMAMTAAWTSTFL